MRYSPPYAANGSLQVAGRGQHLVLFICRHTIPMLANLVSAGPWLVWRNSPALPQQTRSYFQVSSGTCPLCLPLAPLRAVCPQFGAMRQLLFSKGPACSWAGPVETNESLVEAQKVALICRANEAATGLRKTTLLQTFLLHAQKLAADWEKSHTQRERHLPE